MPLFERGPQGPAGPPGRKGHTLFAGSGAPLTSLGSDGDTYIDKDVPAFYGPKVDDDWGAPVALGSTATATAAGGSNGQGQYNNSGILAGTDRFTHNATTGEMHHSGKPVHEETRIEFSPQGASGSALSFSQSAKIKTNGTTPTNVGTFDVPAATFGDCRITVTVEVSYAFVSSGTKGGEFLKKAAFTRTSGVLTRDSIKDLSAGINTGTAAGGFDIVRVDDDTIAPQVTGIASTDVTWNVSAHVQIVQV